MPTNGLSLTRLTQSSFVLLRSLVRSTRRHSSSFRWPYSLPSRDGQSPIQERPAFLPCTGVGGSLLYRRLASLLYRGDRTCRQYTTLCTPPTQSCQSRYDLDGSDRIVSEACKGSVLTTRPVSSVQETSLLLYRGVRVIRTIRTRVFRIRNTYNTYDLDTSWNCPKSETLLKTSSNQRWMWTFFRILF